MIIGLPMYMNSILGFSEETGRVYFTDKNNQVIIYIKCLSKNKNTFGTHFLNTIVDYKNSNGYSVVFTKKQV